MREKNLPMLTPLTGSALLSNAGAAARWGKVIKQAKVTIN